MHCGAGDRGAELLQAETLTEREVEIVRLVAEGKSNRAIGWSTGLALGTVKDYLGSAMKKLGARNRTHTVILAIQRGILLLAGDERSDA